MSTLITITADDIRRGDRFINADGSVAWTAIDDAADLPTATGDDTGVRVEYPDGATDWRFWDKDRLVEFIVTELTDGRRLLNRKGI
jgi:hypothetical protein